MSWPDARIKLSIQIETDIFARAQCSPLPRRTTSTSTCTSHRQSLVNAPPRTTAHQRPVGPWMTTWMVVKKDGKKQNPWKLVTLSELIKHSAKVIKMRSADRVLSI